MTRSLVINPAVIILDTNVISEMLRPVPEPAVAAWLAAQDADNVYLTAVTAAELRYGAAILAKGRRRDGLMAPVEAILNEDFAGQILGFDDRAAVSYARIGSQRREAGSPISQFDCQIAAICHVEDAVLATRNTRDFTGCGVQMIDPWQR